ncbi:uncharacterized protein LOC132704740 [Cylas formicarius]|uniref:uncharacterized protein LOC132704740 n=1 Tax=Cylas formicarius TaxID=197179 RepID=UPI002958817E|nr:uncharacterized protein LOC132704740 [Cylas formicarius]XP_060530945.1 uncharacterized protein LOC132704740 [Cylas formicarius]XP_060530953.1 uncharacterized protein LOC132704740 [Cylas formicarius]XP_060530962.1 uncharacterized protein LOC132704740 [Cylas formicarius]XP_060530971.1 uncharacterized protein LOC132704740 [Cylas formicarius]XP_060530979.1 uncharacterized protein LOC132704740 [Cylas formicarius]
MKKFSVISGLHDDKLNQSYMNPSPGSSPAPVHGVNIILGGAMLSGIILVIFLLCYCCHKTNRKSNSNLSTIWRDPTLSLQIYTVEAAQNRLVDLEDYPSGEDPSRCPSPGPPPPYEVVVPEYRPPSGDSKWSDSTGLPSYEAAVKNIQSSLHEYP